MQAFINYAMEFKKFRKTIFTVMYVWKKKNRKNQVKIVFRVELLYHL